MAVRPEIFSLISPTKCLPHGASVQHVGWKNPRARSTPAESICAPSVALLGTLSSFAPRDGAASLCAPSVALWGTPGIFAPSYGAARLCASSVALWGTRRIFAPSDGAAASCSHPGTRPATAEDEGEAAEEDQADFARDETGHAPL